MAIFTANRANADELALYKEESVAGTYVAPDTAFAGLMVNLTPHFEQKLDARVGNHYDDVTRNGRAWTEVDFSGPMQFNPELAFLLGLVYSKVVGTHPGGATIAYSKSIVPANFGSDTYASVSLLKGGSGSGNAERCAGVFGTDFGYKGDLDSTDVTAKAIGNSYTRGVTRASSFSSLPEKPVARTNIGLYISTDNTFASGVITELRGVQSYEFSDAGVREAGFDVHPAGDYGSTTNLKHTTSFKCTMFRNAQAQAFADAYAAGTPIYLMYQALGANIETTINYLIQHKMYLLPRPYTAPNNNTGAAEWDFEFALGTDPAWGSSGGQSHQFDIIGITA